MGTFLNLMEATGADQYFGAALLAVAVLLVAHQAVVGLRRDRRD